MYKSKKKNSKRSHHVKPYQFSPMVNHKEMRKYAGDNNLNLFTALMLTLRGHQRKQRKADA